MNYWQWVESCSTAKAKALLGWNPSQTPFPELVRRMAHHDYNYVEKLHS